MTKDPEKGEGLDQLFEKGKALETERDVALRKDPYFDWSQALLQIAIVLASVHLIIGNLMLLGLSGGLAALGLLLMMNGNTLAICRYWVRCEARPGAFSAGSRPPAPPLRDDLFKILFTKNGTLYVVTTQPEYEAWLTDILTTWQFID